MRLSVIIIAGAAGTAPITGSDVGPAAPAHKLAPSPTATGLHPGPGGLPLAVLITITTVGQRLATAPRRPPESAGSGKRRLPAIESAADADGAESKKSMRRAGG